jgi:hypothetical protein
VFHDILGNGIDADQSELSIRDTHLLRIYDQAIAVGQGSTASVHNVLASDVGIAVAGRDMAGVKIQDLVVERAWMAGLATYLRDAAYGPATLRATRVTFQDEKSIRALVQAGSRVTINGELAAPSAFDSQPLLWRGQALSGVRVLSYRFGDEVRLLGYDLGPARAAPGQEVRLVLYWQALGEIECEYSVFVHVLDSSGHLVAQADSMPRNDAFPTTHWLAGRVVDDPHAILLPQDLSPGPYRVAVGLYYWQTGERLTIRRLDGEAIPDGMLYLEPRIEVE